MPVRARFAAPVAAFAVAAALAACGGSPQRSTSRFCSELDRQLPGLQSSGTESQEELDALVARFEDLGGMTPLAVEDDWQRLTELVRTAATVAPGDPESVQKAIDATYATERAYRRIHDWAATNCGITMPDVGGIETATLPPADTTPPT